MKYIILFLIFLTTFVYADDFSSRAKAGDEASSTVQGKQYQASYGRLIVKAIQTCIPPGASDPSNNGKFTFVAYVNMAGQISEAEVQPTTKMSSCFSNEFSKFNLPAPPQENSTSFGYPITIPMSITP